MTSQKGFAHVFLIVGLVVTLIGALGFIFWQNFIYQEPVTTKTEIISKPSNESVDKAPLKAELSKKSLANALPSGCILGVSDGTLDFDVNKLTKLTATNAASGPLDFKEFGRINESESWVYVAGGCGSSAGGFLLNDKAGIWDLVAYHTGDAWFTCSKVDGLGVPKEVIGLCLTENGKEKAIQQ